MKILLTHFQLLTAKVSNRMNERMGHLMLYLFQSCLNNAFYYFVQNILNLKMIYVKGQPNIETNFKKVKTNLNSSQN